MIQERYFEKVYKQALNENGLLVNNGLSDLNTNEIDLLNGFHAKETLTIKKDDEYFCGARAETFIIMLGWNEHSYYFDYEDIVLIQSNHKGHMHFTMFGH
ncbi:hypothetical protein [Staphylococcus equorum]|uniref:hypothetical protein n=1 Tax=Staphylococcus equorum TaxID=246432 RepID=UPI002552C0B0|nr:hypothetical protein [Staphylococcus equorum]MDK9867816.1 hypothetical protein [Staphylococcus equorum]